MTLLPCAKCLEEVDPTGEEVSFEECADALRDLCEKLELAGREVVSAHAAMTTAAMNRIFGDDFIPCADRMGRAIDALAALIK